MVNPKDHRDLKCEYCKRTLDKANPDSALYATRDHYYPKSKNRAGPHLLVWACRFCNELKGDRLPAEWERFMLRNPRWWEHPYLTGKSRPEPMPKPPPLPIEHSLYILKHGKKAYKAWVAQGCPAPVKMRPLRKDEPIPAHEDPAQQAAFEAYAKKYRHVLRVPDDEPHSHCP